MLVDQDDVVWPEIMGKATTSMEPLLNSSSLLSPDPPTPPPRRQHIQELKLWSPVSAMINCWKCSSPESSKILKLGQNPLEILRLVQNPAHRPPPTSTVPPNRIACF